MSNRAPGNCALCGIICRSRCKRCHKVTYCSHDHLMEDWSRHIQVDCFVETAPTVTEVHDDHLGNHLIAAQTLKAGDTILTDFPLLFAPTSSLPEFRKLCLTCSKRVKSNYSCAYCTWPLCGVACQRATVHRENECSVFQREQIDPELYETTEVYVYIQLLRGFSVKAKKGHEEIWKILKCMESHREHHQIDPDFLAKADRCFHFLTEICKLSDIDLETTKLLAGIWDINTFEPRCVSVLPVPENFECEARLYSGLSKLTHGCVSNAKVIASQSRAGKERKRVDLVATEKIEKGETIVQFYGNPESGTRQRQRLQTTAYYFSCECKRCTDPTELGTFYSALKCKNQDCNGYILPVHPRDLDASWRCISENCKAVMTVQEVDEFICRLGEETKKVCEEFYQKSNALAFGDISGALNIFEELEKKLEKLQAESVHENHFATFEIKYCIMDSLRLLLRNNTNANFVLATAEKMERYARKCLTVYDLFFPGLTPERGRYMFFVSFAMTETVTTKFKFVVNRNRSSFLEETRICLETQKEALEMLTGMPEGSEAFTMCNSLRAAIEAMTRLYDFLSKTINATMSDKNDNSESSE